VQSRYIDSKLEIDSFYETHFKNIAEKAEIVSKFGIKRLVQIDLPYYYFFVPFEHQKKQMLSHFL